MNSFCSIQLPTSIQDIDNLTSILEHVLTSIAILSGGIWAWFRFVKAREGIWNLEVKIRYKIHPYFDSKRLLTLYVDLKNIGKVNVEPGGRGCEASIVALPDNCNLRKILKWDEGRVILNSYNIIAKRGSDRDRRPFYSIEPGCMYTELLNIVVESNKIILVQIRFWWKDDWDCITQYKTITVS